jgi:hypothetical protein
MISRTACGLAGLCYAEMASTVPVAGSAYTYSYATMGEFAAWIIGWDLVLEYAMGSATVGVGWSGYFVSLLDYFGLHLPAAVTSAPLRWCSSADVVNAVAGCAGAGWNRTGSLFNLPAVLIVLPLFGTTVWLHQYERGLPPSKDAAPSDEGPERIKLWSFDRLYRHPGSVEIETLMLLVYPVLLPLDWYPYVAAVAAHIGKPLDVLGHSYGALLTMPFGPADWHELPSHLEWEA